MANRHEQVWPTPIGTSKQVWESFIITTLLEDERKEPSKLRKKSFSQLLKATTTTIAPHLLPLLGSNPAESSSPVSFDLGNKSPSLSDFGNSTGLFDNIEDLNSSGFYKQSPSPTKPFIVEKGKRAWHAPNHSSNFNSSGISLSDSESSLPHIQPGILGGNKTADQVNSPDQVTVYNMVNERSPAKAQAAPTLRADDNLGPPIEKPLQSDNMTTASFGNIHARSGQEQIGAAPRFGQPTMLQSPLRTTTNASQRTSGPDRSGLNSNLFIKPQPKRQEFVREQPRERPEYPHLQSVKDFGKKLLPGHSKYSSDYTPAGSDAQAGIPIPISRPSGPTYNTTQPAPSTSYGSLGTIYQGGFKSVNNAGQWGNPIDLTGPSYRDPLNFVNSEPYSFVDPKKAAEDLKALLEGAIEDDDDIPRTRLRKKKKDAETDGLISKLQGLAVTEDQPVEEDDDDDDDGTIEGINVKLLPHQVEGLSWMRDRELGKRKKGTVPKGGILADDMGLGKTLQSVSLIITNPRPTGSDLEDGKRKFPAAMTKCTLVVAPLALIRQWELEIKDKVSPSHALRVIVHHGPQRTKRYEDLKKYDVVITTYQILVSEFGNSSNDPDGLQVGCFGIHWYRVILDEAHTIKNRNAKATQACYALRSEYRWCLTGTPMQNNLDELQSLIKFLRIKPYDDLKQWKDQIDRPMKNGRGDVAIKRLQLYLKIFMKRRTKEILKKEGALNPGGKPSAPGAASTTGFKVTERRIEKVFAEFSAEERLFYDKLQKRTDKSLEMMMDGKSVNYASALVLLLRLRQACNHPRLVAGKLGKDGEALGAEAANVGATSKSKSANIDVDVDDLAGMFGDLGVNSKKCDVCQLELSKELSASGAVRCEECEADLLLTEKKHKHKSRHHKSTRPKIEDSEDDVRRPTPLIRKPRNRQQILDSDDEEEDDGEWIVGEEKRGATKLGKCGGTDDENAEGEGISLHSEDEGEEESFSYSDDESDLPSPSKIAADKKGGTKKEPVDVNTDSFISDDESAGSVEDELHSSDDEDDELSKLSTIVSSTKITHLLKILSKEVDEHKFIVFSQFTSMLDLIEPFFKRDGYKYTRYDGSMRNDLREASLARLRNEKSCRILLCSLKCGSLGLNLTAATRVVILEPFWNPVSNTQNQPFSPTR
jgi:SNF2 family DNA or RNA helicase